jgi:hypothetical protein
MLGGGAFFYYFLYLAEILPPGRYPFWFFLGPVVIGGVIFFYAAGWVLRRLGIDIFIDKKD